MFTIDQIINAHSKVKSGADFPAYIKEMSGLGITLYEHFVSDGNCVYYGSDNFSLNGPAKYPMQSVNSQTNLTTLKSSLKIHQAGQTTYLQFCQEAAMFGVEKWIVDLGRKTCTYYSQQGEELLVEEIPG